MKKILLFALSLTVTGAFAQTWQLTDDLGNDVTNGTLDMSGVNAPTDIWFKHELDVHIENVSGAPVVTKCVRYETAVLTGSTHYHCFGVNCYGDIDAGVQYQFPGPLDVESLDEITLMAGGTNTIFSYLKPKTGVGPATFRYVIFDANNTSDSVYVDVTFNISAVGVEELQRNLDVTIFPNPANERTSVRLEGNENETGMMSVEVTDLLGKKQSVKEIPANTNNVEVETFGLTPGVYFLAIRKDGHLLRSTKLVVKH